MMKKGWVVGGMLVLMSFAGQAERQVPSTVVWLELGQVEKPAKPGGLREGELRPAFSLKKSADGSLWGKYELRLGWPEHDQSVAEQALDREQAEMLLGCLEGYVKKGFLEKAGQLEGPPANGWPRRPGCYVGPLNRGKVNTGVAVVGVGGTARILHEDCPWAVAMLRKSLNDAERLELFLLARKNGGEAKLLQIGVRGWTASWSEGVMDLEELGKVRVSFCHAQTPWPELGWERKKKGADEPNFRMIVGGVGRVPSPAARLEFLEALGAIPRHQREGIVFRWEKGAELLRAFPENKAIFYRRAGKKDVRISQEVVEDAEGILEKRDQMKKWCQEKVVPALQVLKEKGDPAVFELLG